MKPIVICLTPVRNEAWILDAFIRCASRWADLIIIADQSSRDETREIARRHPRVRLIGNASSDFNEPERQKLLIEAAREIPGPRILVALDADEFLSGNWKESPDWARILAAPPGTLFSLRWLNVFPDFSRGSDNTYGLPCIYVDDGRKHRGLEIHSPRVPMAEGENPIVLNDLRLLHFNFSDPARLASKRRWYFCLERIKFPEKSLIQIYDKYNYRDFHAQLPTVPLRTEWLQGLAEAGLTPEAIQKTDQDGLYWYDREVAAWIEEYGKERFAFLPIWQKGLPWSKAPWSTFVRLKQAALFFLLEHRFNPLARAGLVVLRWLGV